MKTKLMIAVFTVLVLGSCAKKEELPALDTIYGTYNGTLTASGSNMSAYCQVTKIDNTYLGMGIGQTGSGPSMAIDSLVVTAGTVNYTLSHDGGFSGNINGTSLTWSDGFYTFTGTK